MAFDLNTAKPATDTPGGFDMATAKPVSSMGEPTPTEAKAISILERQKSGEIGEAKAALLATANGIEDIYSTIGGYVPDMVKNFAAETVKTVGNVASEFWDSAGYTPTGKLVNTAAPSVEEKYKELKNKHPDIVETLDAAVTVGEPLLFATPVGHRVATRKLLGESVKSADKTGLLAKYKTNAFGEAVVDKNAIALMDNGIDAGVIREIQLSSRPIKPVKPVSAQVEAPKVTRNNSLIAVNPDSPPPVPPSKPPTISGGGRGTQSKLIEMTRVKKRGMLEPTYRRNNKASNVLGDSVKERFTYVLNKNKEAAGKLRIAANGLKGRQVNVTKALERFRKDMTDMDVKRNLDTGEIVFSDSTVRWNPTAKKLIRQITTELEPILARGGTADAYEMHKLKKAIDDLVSYGKNAKGLTGETERVLKNIRNAIDGELDKNFGFYNQVNTQYADTVGLLDEFQGLVGKKVDLTAKNADSAIGRTMRNLTSNNQNRERTANLIG